MLILVMYDSASVDGILFFFISFFFKISKDHAPCSSCKKEGDHAPASCKKKKERTMFKALARVVKIYALYFGFN